MKNKCTKGEFLYFQKKKNMEIIKTLLLFGISAALYVAGIIATGSNKNYLTIVAIFCISNDGHPFHKNVIHIKVLIIGSKI